MLQMWCPVRGARIGLGNRDTDARLDRGERGGQPCSSSRNDTIWPPNRFIEANAIPREEATMAFMLKVHWDIKKDKVADFKSNQQALCKVMLEHPGVICYHVDYPSEGVSEWVEIFANDDAFRAHLANEKGKGPLGTL